MRMKLDQDKFDKIKRILKTNPKGCTIMELSKKLNTNRNSVAKYLEMLLISGQVEMETYGTAKVYILSQRVPVSGLLEISSDLILVLDGDLKIVQVNDKFVSFFSRERKDLLGTSLTDHDLPLLSHLPLESLTWEITRYGETEKELSFLKDGREFHFRIKFIPTVFDDGGKGITLQMEDITLQKRYERSLQLSEARYRAIVEDQTELICRRLPNGTITFVNGAFCRYFQKSPEELVGHRFDPAPLGQKREKMLESLSPDHPVKTFEQEVFLPTKEIRWLQWTERALMDENGTIGEYQSVGRDITEKKKADRELFVRDTAMASSIDGIAIINPQSEITYTNHALRSMFGFHETNEIIGKKFYDAIADQGEFLPDSQWIRSEMMDKGRWFGEVNLKRSDGSQRYFLLSLTKVNDEHGIYLCSLVSLVDITDQKLLEEAFKSTYEKLQETIEFFPDATFIVDRNHQVVAWNRSMEALTGVRKADMMGRNNYQQAFALYGDIRPVLVDLIDLPVHELAKRYPQVRRFGNNLFVEAYIPGMNKGQGAHLWGKAIILTDEDGRPIGAIEMVRDITEWKRAAEIRKVH